MVSELLGESDASSQELATKASQGLLAQQKAATRRQVEGSKGRRCECGMIIRIIERMGCRRE